MRLVYFAMEFLYLAVNLLAAAQFHEQTFGLVFKVAVHERSGRVRQHDHQQNYTNYGWKYRKSNTMCHKCSQPSIEINNENIKRFFLVLFKFFWKISTSFDLINICIFLVKILKNSLILWLNFITFSRKNLNLQE